MYFPFSLRGVKNVLKSKHSKPHYSIQFGSLQACWVWLTKSHTENCGPRPKSFHSPVLVVVLLLLLFIISLWSICATFEFCNNVHSPEHHLSTGPRPQKWPQLPKKISGVTLSLPNIILRLGLLGWIGLGYLFIFLFF